MQKIGFKQKEKEMMPLVSVITPVFNGAGTLSKTLRSLAGQQYPHVEFIFVNDGSRDASLQELEGFKRSMPEEGHRSVKIVTHPMNRGVAAARNSGLDVAEGDYIYYVDADDWIENDAIEVLVRKAMETEADVVGCNWYLNLSASERRMNQPVFFTPEEAVEGILCGVMRWNLWLFLAKRTLYEKNGIRFISGKNMGEDLFVTLQLFAQAKRVAYLDRPLYHYSRANEQSMTTQYTERHMEEVSANLRAVRRYLAVHYADREEWLEQQMHYLELNIKLPLLISGKKEDYKRWKTWFPESNARALSNRKQSLRIRLLQWAAVREWYGLIYLHYLVMDKIIYGIIYK